MTIIITLILAAFFCFGVFFVYKQIEFFVLSVNLYKKMISQQDTIISLLRTVDKNKGKKCPSCAEIIKTEALKCRYCGEIFDPASIQPQVEDQIQDNVNKYSGYVLIEGKSDEAFCYGCKTVSPINGMYHHRESGRYYHEECLPN